MAQKLIVWSVLVISAAIMEACTPSTPSPTPTATSALLNVTPTAADVSPNLTSTAKSISPSATPIAASASRSATPTVTSASPNLSFSHVYLIVMENHSYGDIVGNSSAPYINSLIANFGLATHYNAVAHPSQPNYLALFSGSTQGIANDAVYNLDRQNVADQIEANGKTWKVFAQNVPPDCFTGAAASGGADGAGTYARKHEPAISFTNIRTLPARCNNITDFTHFDPAAANFEFIAPNLCNDMHDCPIATGDAFLQGFVPMILDSSAWQQGGVLFITWDEGEGDTNNQVTTLVISNAVPKGFQSDVAHDHYSLLRTIEDTWGLGCLNETCGANNLSEFFH